MIEASGQRLYLKLPGVPEINHSSIIIILFSKLSRIISI